MLQAGWWRQVFLVRAWWVCEITFSMRAGQGIKILAGAAAELPRDDVVLAPTGLFVAGLRILLQR